jgi:asparagine synthase (glutamine-hydrolysing)
MCGLNGIFAYNTAAGLPEEPELLATSEAMRARGPDGAGCWWSLDRRCGLAHRRLAILDLSDRASQPLISEDGGLVVVFDGEIYNYPELRAELEAGGVRFRTSSDTESLLHLYVRYGAEMVHRLRGMFAFAIWDARRHSLFLARDPYGIKPLYTANDGWTFRFASQVKALLAGGRISRDPEPAGHVGFYLFGSVLEPFTLFRDVRALPAGHTQWIDAVGPREPKSFANLAGILAIRRENRRPAAELADLVRTAVSDSLSAHLLADVEVGVLLSAGIGSGALLGLMREASHRDIRAITLAFEELRGTDEDEVPLAAQVAERYAAYHVVRRVGKCEFLEDLPAILDAMDQPSIDGINTWFVSKAAREAGLKVVISGLGGDELLGGCPSFVDVPRWRRRFGLLAALPGCGWLARQFMLAFPSLVATARPRALALLEYASSWAGAYLLHRGLFAPHELVELMERDFVREGLRRLKPLRRLAATLVPDPGSDAARICVLESSHHMRNQLLRDADWAGMSHGVQIRVPLVDATLLKSLAPIIAKVASATGKAALARAPSTPLPEAVLGRAKNYSSVPMGPWMSAAYQHEKPSQREREPKGLDSRHWSREVLAGFVKPAREAHAS